MPELPEVETIRRGLSKLIVGRKVIKVCHDNQRSFPNAQHDVDNFLIGAEIVSISRRAKVLMIDFSTQYTLVIHLKMTGQLVYRGETNFGAGHPTDSLTGKLPDRSTRVTFVFDDKSHLFFNDQRKFGWVKLLPAVEVSNMDFMKKVGPEPLDDSFTSEEFATRFRHRSKTSIKAALLDQSVVAGVGNIYADESLWSAKIHPKRLVNTITSGEFETLYNSVRFVMNLSIDKGGSTDRNYVDAEGKKGNYLDFANVFRREGQVCPRCGATIIKLRVVGRGTHICPNCQVMPER
jgi:formamidopyrimidine-DNA glycosylase